MSLRANGSRKRAPDDWLREAIHRAATADAETWIASSQALQRRGRIFLDYLHNGRGTTAIGTYSPRAREGFPIAAPVTWARIERGIGADAFTMRRPFRTPASFLRREA